jgi:hypothetical protein
MVGWRFQCCTMMYQPRTAFRTIRELVATREALGNVWDRRKVGFRPVRGLVKIARERTGSEQVATCQDGV